MIRSDDDKWDGELEVGKFYLFACPRYWTFVGRFVRQMNFRQILVEDVIHFTRTGATFDILCSKGLQSETKTVGPFERLPIPADNIPFPWMAKTPWVK